MKLLRIWLLLMVSLVAMAAAKAQYNPSNPAEPGEVNLTLATMPAGAGYTGASKSMALPGTSVDVWASAYSEYRFVNWTNEAGEVVSTSSSFSYIMPSKSATLTANFVYAPGSPGEPTVSPVYSRIFTEVTPVDAGYLNLSNGQLYEVGTSVWISAYTYSGFRFDGWLLNGVPTDYPSSFNYTVTDEDAKFTAKYVYEPSNPDEPQPTPLTYTLYIDQTPADAGYFSTSIPRKYAVGEEVDIRAYCNSGFKFLHWLRDGEVISTSETLQMQMPAANVKLVAVYEYSPSNPSDPNADSTPRYHFYGMRVGVHEGEKVNFPVYFENFADAIGASFDVTIPEGFTADAEEIILTDRCYGHTLSTELVNEGSTIRVVIRGSELIQGVNGAIAYVTMLAPAEAEWGTIYNVNVTKGVVVKTDGAQVPTSTRGGSIEILPPDQEEVKSADFVVSDISVTADADMAPGGRFLAAWTVSNIGSLPATAGWTERISLVSSSGRSVTVATDAYTLDDDELLPTGIVKRSREIVIPDLPGIDGDVALRITLVPDQAAGEIDEKQTNNTAETASPVFSLSKYLVLEVAEEALLEGSTVTARCQLKRSGDWSESQVFNISVEGDSRLSVPATVTIPKNQSAAYFYITLSDNDDCDGDGSATITVGDGSYPSVSATVAILDDEMPALTLTPVAEDLTEGQTVTITLALAKASDSDLIVNLISSDPKRLTVPANITVPSGATSVTFEATAVDDNDIQTPADITVKASASGYESAECYLMVYDNDVPEISLTLSPTIVTEDAGANATIGTITRHTNIDKSVTIIIESECTEVFFSASKLVMRAGQEKADFSIGVIDNNIVDGDRSVSVTAAIYASSCSCSMPDGTQGAVTATFTITDNDGPALTIIPASTTLVEGSKGNVFTVSRNTSTLNPLTVEIESTADSVLEYQHTVIIPANASSATFAVDVPVNDVTDDSGVITFTVKAADHSTGSCWVTLTDTTLPDAVISDLKADRTEIEAGEVVNVSVTVTNRGSIALPPQTPVNVYFSAFDDPTKLYTPEALEPGQSVTMSYDLQLPKLTGKFVLKAIVNEDRRVKEQIYTNNSSTPVDIRLLSGLTFGMSTDKDVYQQGETVTITGHAHGNIEKDGFVEVYVVNNGARQSHLLQVDENLEFVYTYQPAVMQAGHFSVGACFAGENLSDELVAFDIYGMETTPRFVSVEVTRGESASATVSIINPGTLPLTGLNYSLADNEYASFVVEGPTEIAGKGSADVKIAVEGKAVTSGSSWLNTSLVMTSAEGATVVYPVYYFVSSPQAVISASSTAYKATVTKLTSREIMVDITNVGKGETGDITIDTGGAQWLKTAASNTLPSLKSGESTTVVFTLTALEDMQLNNPVKAKAAINCFNGDGILIDFTMEPVSETMGTLTVDVCDEFTYYTKEAPHVKGARVAVKHPVTGAVIATNDTDESGRSVFNLPEGYYKLEVTEPKHDSHSSTILLNPGVNNVKVVNLGVNSVSVSIRYEQTTIEDSYEIVTDITYETNVPVPVIETIVPDYIPADDLGLGESLIFNAIMTNKGIIASENTQFITPEITDGLMFTVLGENGFRIAPQQTVIVPVKVTRMSMPDLAPRRAPTDESGCSFQTITYYESYCGDDNKIHTIPHHIRYKVCHTKPSTGSVTSIGSLWMYMPSWPTTGPGSRPGGKDVTPSTHEPLTLTDQRFNVCDTCVGVWVNRISRCLGYDPDHPLQSIIKLAADMNFVGCAMDIYNDHKEHNLGKNGGTLFGCAMAACKAIGAVLVSVTPETGGASGAIGGGMVAVCEFLDDGKEWYDCIKPMFEPCPRSAGGSKKAPAPELDNRRVGPVAVDPGSYPGYIAQMQERLAICFDTYNGFRTYCLELLGTEDFYESSNDELAQMFEALALQSVDNLADAKALDNLRPKNITRETFAAFIERYNNTLLLQSGVDVTGDHIDLDVTDSALELIIDARQRMIDLGYSNMSEMVQDAVKNFNEGYLTERSSVCSSVSLRISQTVTMTRQAIRATLDVTNGHDFETLREAKLAFSVLAPDGTVVGSDIMHIAPESLNGFQGELSLDSGWSLEANSQGTATILFIPTKNAAPTQPVDYTFTGTLSYLDPFTGLTVVRDLSSATLTVNPSPVLDLTYFMQRDVLGDDPLTPEVEPREAAEFTVVVNNKGYGDATNLRFLTKQPEIIENSKGLLIDFAFVGASLDGEQMNITLGESIPTDFGTVPAHKAKYAQWWLESSLLGHFTSYNVSATHLTSYGNEDLSLLDRVEIHELVHGFTPMAEGGAKRAFLVNDIADLFDAPDMVYTSDGLDARSLSTESTASLSSHSDDQYILSISPVAEGWTYGSIVDDLIGSRKVKSVVRIADGAEVPVDNVWTTAVTLNDAHEPTYEGRLHYVVEAQAGAQVDYLVTFEEQPDVFLAVQTYAGVPDEGEFASAPVEQIEITFNKDIDPATFTVDDLSLTCQGQKIEMPEATIEAKDARSFTVQLGKSAAATGYYTLLVSTKTITDTDGFNGKSSSAISWVQVVDGYVRFTVTADPKVGGVVTPSEGVAEYGSEVEFCAVPAEGYSFAKWTVNDGVVSEDATFTTVPTEGACYTALFRINYYNLDITIEGDGGVVSGGGSGLYPYGSSLALEALPNPGYKFSHWVVDGEISDDVVLPILVQSDHAIVAVFVEDPSLLDYIRVDATMVVLPMPIREYFTIYGEIGEIRKVELIDISGHICMIDTDVELGQRINADSLVPGFYILRVTSDLGVFSRRMIKG